jgi:DNA polymerase-3 subunit beta
MKIECIKNSLSNALVKAEKISGKNQTLPILSSILLETKNSSLCIKATNLDIGLQITIPVKVSRSGSVAVPGNTLSGFVSNLSEDKNIVLEEKNGVLHVSSKGSVSLIKTILGEDFPTLPQPSGKNFKIPIKDLINGLKAVWYSCAVTGIKPELSSVYVYSDKNELVFVATDSFRLAEQRINTKKPFELEQLLIPFKNTAEIIRLLDGVDGEILIEVDNSQISFTHEGLYLVSRTIDGNFPDYKQIIPKEVKTEALVLKQDLLQALKVANVFSDSFRQITFNLDPKKKKFEAVTRNPDVGEGVNEIEAILKGEELSISFNFKYIMDCLQAITSDSITLSFSGLSKPLIIRGVSDQNFLYLVMPMNR